MKAKAPQRVRQRRAPKSSAQRSEDRLPVGASSGGVSITLNGRTLALSNLDKIFYPQTGFTKGQVIDYYARISRVLLPHLKARCVTMKRYPDGVESDFFYEKRCPSYRPPWVKTASVWSSRQGATIPFCLFNDLPSLIWAVNLADLELHTSLAHHQKPDRPLAMVFDLDPGPEATLLDCAQTAFWLRDFLGDHQLDGWVKSSGSKGLQVYVPLNTPVTFEQTKGFARFAAETLTTRYPDKVLYRMEKHLRKNKVFVDWSQNDSHKTTVCVYSLRAMEHPTVSTPLKWEELKRALKAREPAGLSFECDEVLRRVEKMGDLFEPVLTTKQTLPRLSQ